MTAEEPALARLRLALDELADAETAALVREARIEARARVRSLLAEAMAERMLARAETELFPDDRGDRAGARAAVAGAKETARARRGSRAAAERDRSQTTERRRTGRPAAADSGKGGPRKAASDAPKPRKDTAKAGKAAGDGELAWYVYGVVDDGFAAPPMLGVDDAHSLEVVRGATLGALASRVPLAEFGEVPLRERMEDLAWLERNARRHEQILEGVREQRATVVPMRLFTIYETDASLRDMLDREHEFLAAALARLTCRTEWGVKLFAHAHGEELADLFAPEDADDADQPSGEERPGESYMLRRRSADRRHEAASRRLDGYRDAAHRRLATLSVEARVNPLQPPELSEHEGAMLMNGVYLVDDDAAEAFAAAVSSLQEDFAQDGIDVVLTGPWPPYNFVNSAQEAGV